MQERGHHRALEMPDLADDAVRVLALNYPDHPFVTGQDQDQGFWSRMWPF